MLVVSTKVVDTLEDIQEWLDFLPGENYSAHIKNANVGDMLIWTGSSGITIKKKSEVYTN